MQRSLRLPTHALALLSCVQVYENEGSLFFQDWTQLPTRKRMEAWDRQFKSLAALPVCVGGWWLPSHSA